MKTYIIKYYYFTTDGQKITPSSIKVKNCTSDIHAKIRLESYLKKHNSDFGNLIVESCREDLGTLGGIFSSFNDIFGGKL